MKPPTLLVLSSMCVLVGCPLDVIVTSGGMVVSSATTEVCSSGNTCRFDINDMNFNETFTAVPEHGYVFIHWEKGQGSMCGGSTDPVCAISMPLLQGNAIVEALVASDTPGNLRPLFGVDLSFGDDNLLWGLPTDLFRELPAN